MESPVSSIFDLNPDLVRTALQHLLHSPFLPRDTQYTQYGQVLYGRNTGDTMTTPGPAP